MNPYYEPYWLNSDELEHYGVKGMKWGIRKDPERSRQKLLKKLKRADTKVAKGSAKLLEGQEKLRAYGRKGQAFVDTTKQMPDGRKKAARMKKSWKMWNKASKMDAKLGRDAAKVWNDQTKVINILRQLTKEHGDTALSSTDPQIMTIGERYIRSYILNDRGEEMYLTSTEPKVYANVLKKK